jgi:hypothetical protein
LESKKTTASQDLELELKSNLVEDEKPEETELELSNKKKLDEIQAKELAILEEIMNS